VWNLAPAAGRRSHAIPPAVPSGGGARNIFPLKPLPNTRPFGSEPRARNDRQDASDMIPSDIYQQRASECLQLAEGSSDIAERTRWRELALCWLRLSEYAEQFRPAERPLRMA
jgi:hypothetical protein